MGDKMLSFDARSERVGRLSEGETHPTKKETKLKDLPTQVEADGKTYGIVGKPIGEGGFGVVCEGEGDDGQKVAIKFERVHHKDEGEYLPEQKAYRDLRSVDGFPRVYHEGRLLKKNENDEGKVYFTIMELLGPSLRNVMKNEPQRITADWIIDIGTQAITILEKMHSQGYVHCDIKPHNLLLGHSDGGKEKLFLIDLGLATQWRLKSPDRHVEYVQEPHRFRGTVVYASVNILLGRKPSRRDDLVSLAYTLIYLKHKELPWQTHEQVENIEEEKEKRHFLICKDKAFTSPKKLCTCINGSVSSECSRTIEFLEYVVALKFEEEPDYNHCISLLRGTGSPKLPIEVRTGKPPAPWISVYDSRKPTKQRYHYDVTDKHLDRFIEKGKKECLFVSSVTSCNDLWCLVIDDGTGYANQIYHLNESIDKGWIEEKWKENYFVTAIAGAKNGSFLTFMSKGTQYTKQILKVHDYFPAAWVSDKWTKHFYITSMATIGTKWAIIMSQMDSTLQQFNPKCTETGTGMPKQSIQLELILELDFAYPKEGIRRRWEEGFRITAIAATECQAAFVFDKPKESTNNPRRQDTRRTFEFPSTPIKEKWASNLYVTSLCYGLTFRLEGEV